LAALPLAAWNIPLRRLDIRLSYWRWGYGGWQIWYIKNPYLRRQHFRAVFWLPRQ
jgi:hypothetical protein